MGLKAILTRVKILRVPDSVDIDLLQLSPHRVALGIRHPSPEEIASLKNLGVTQPLCVRPVPDTRPQRYEILTGHTIWLAAQLVGVQRLPLLIRDDLSDQEARAAVQEDRQPAQNDNPLERARVLQRLVDANPRMKRSDLCQRLGMTISNLSHHLRLLELPSEIQGMVEAGALKYGHARALCGLERRPTEQVRLARLVARQELSVRVVEASVRAILVEGCSLENALRQAKGGGSKREGGQSPAPTCEATVAQAPTAKDSDILRLEQSMAEQLGSPVEIEHRDDGSGALIIRYHNLDILDGIIARLGIGEAW